MEYLYPNSSLIKGLLLVLAVSCYLTGYLIFTIYVQIHPLQHYLAYTYWISIKSNFASFHLIFIFYYLPGANFIPFRWNNRILPSFHGMIIFYFGRNEFRNSDSKSMISCYITTSWDNIRVTERQEWALSLPFDR